MVEFVNACKTKLKIEISVFKADSNMSYSSSVSNYE